MFALSVHSEPRTQNSERKTDFLLPPPSIGRLGGTEKYVEWIVCMMEKRKLMHRHRRRRNKQKLRRPPSPLMIVISVGLVAAVAALVFWKQPSRKTVDVPKNRALVVQPKTTQNTQPDNNVGPVDQKNFKSVSATVRGPLPHSLRRATDREKAKFLSALAARLLIWKVDLRRGLRRGDKIKLVYSNVDTQSKFQIEAMEYKSLKHNKTYRFYRFQARGEKFGAYYDKNGRSVEQHLDASPMRTYEQVTSILKMRPKHKGVDFKAPQGTKIFLPWRARVIRKNWNTRYNGYCLKVEFTHKRFRGRRVHALFLHLHKIMKGVREGSVLPAGKLIAEVGNTGRSTAPHLHYQMQTPRGRIIDPFRFHQTFHRNLPTRFMSSFRHQRNSLDRILGQVQSGQPRNDRRDNRRNDRNNDDYDDHDDHDH